MLALAIGFWLVAAQYLHAATSRQTYRWQCRPSVDGVSLGMTPGEVDAVLGAPLHVDDSVPQGGRCSLALYRGPDGDRAEVFYTSGLATFVFGHSLCDGSVPVLRSGAGERDLYRILGPPGGSWLRSLTQVDLVRFQYLGEGLTVNATRPGPGFPPRVLSFSLEIGRSPWDCP